jgi:glycosyltransferase involved in cell wall biosynthesis
LRVKKNDNLFITTNPTFLIITLALIKKIKKFNLEILVHDVFPENLVPAGLIKKGSIKYWILSKIFNRAFQKADRIIVLGQDMKELFLQKVSSKVKKVDLIPNWSDNNIYAIEGFNISEYLGIDVKDKIVFGFAGNLGRVQGVLEFIDLFKQSNNPNIILIIIGDGALRINIQFKIDNENLQNVYYLGPKPRSEQNFFLNACHIGVVSLTNGMKGLGVPSKVYNLMAVGKPIFYVGDEGSEIDSYVKKYDCGWSYTWNEDKDVVSFFNELTLGEMDEISIKGAKSKIASANYSKNEILNLF